MGAIRAGGLASGLDTNAIIEELVTATKEPIARLTNDLYLKNLAKSLYKDVDSQLTSLKTSLFNLRMESTFKSKIGNSSSTAVAGAKVTSEAAVGSHVVNVLQTAKNATMSSRFTTARITAGNIGMKGLSGLPYVYDQQEGVHRTQVTTDSGTNKSYAISVFAPDDAKSYTKYTGGQSMNTAFVDEFGTLDLSSLPDTLQFSIKVDGVTVNLDPITIDPTDSNNLAYGVTDINGLMLALDTALNNQLNQQFDTNAEQYVALRADYDQTTGEWKSAIYNVSAKDLSLGVVDAGGTLDDLMGLNGTINKTSTAVIVKYHAAASMADLQTQLESLKTSVVAGTKLTFNTFTEGVMEIVQNSSMNVAKASKTSVISGAAGTAINLTKAMDSGATGLSFSNPASITGTFTINGTKITVDATTHSVNEIMAIVNSSGAGVTMGFDSSTQQFVLTSNKEGISSISLGGEGDTSKFVQIFKLSTNDGAATVAGTTAGNILTTKPIADGAGFTRTMTSGIFSINGVPIYVDTLKDTVEDLIRKVNNSAADVTMAYDSVKDKFVITSNNAGQIVFGGGDTSNALEIMGLTYNKAEMIPLGEKGQSAIIQVDGQTYTRGSNVIDDVLTGITITANSVGTTIIDVSADTDKAVDALAAFVKGFNTLMKSLLPGEIAKDDRDKKMVALTAAQTEAMSDDDYKSYMKDYDALHTQNLILKSRELKTLAKDLRGNTLGVMLQTDSSFKSLSQLGFNVAGASVNGSTADLTLVKYGYLLTESTDLEEIKATITGNTEIMNNLTTKSDDVYTFFAQNKDVEAVDANGNKILNANGTSKMIEYRGWARKYDTMVSAFQAIDGLIGTKTRADSALQKEITSLNKNIATKQLRAEAYLERLWKQFSAMETRVAATQSQSQYIAQITGNTASSNS